MSYLEIIREQVKKLYETNPHIHMDVSITNPRLMLKDAEATITGVYSHIFVIEENMNSLIQHHTLQYTDILTKRIIIHEISEHFEQ